MDRKVDIRCPACSWRPGAEDRWICVPSCGAVWQTFWTRGVCPGCAVRWPKTQCLACSAFSPHEAWYHEPPDRQREADDAMQPAPDVERAPIAAVRT